MAEAGEVSWEIEHIPDEDLLFLRIHHVHITGERISVAAFTPHSGLSTDWSKYATAEWTRGNAGPSATGKPRPAENYGVAFFIVGAVRAILEAPVKVQHKPLPKNRAHTDIEFAEGDKEQVRVALGRLSQWAIMRDA